MYSRANFLQLEGAKTLLAHYIPQMDWGADEDDDKDEVPKAKILDIGCRNGDILVDVLLTKIPPKKVGSVLAVDNSKEMVQEARRRHGSNLKVSFMHYDIGTGGGKTLKQFGPYSHVTSCFWLDWIQDQRRAYTNIFNALQPGGKFFAIFILKHGLVPVYNELAESSKFGFFLKNWWDHIPAYCLEERWRQILMDHLTASGFRNIHIEVRPHMIAHLPSEQAMKESLQTLDYFHRRIPPRFHEEYSNEVFRIFKAQLVPRRVALEHAYDAVMVHAERPTK